MSDLDAFDLALLRCLQQDCRRTSESLAAEVGLSATACQRRLKRLRRSEVIAKEVAVLAPDALGGRMTLIVQVVLARGRADIVDAFKRQVRVQPEIQQCYYVTGDCDFVLIVTAKDIADYETFTRRVFFENPNIQKFHTMVAMENVKLGLEVPV